MTDAMSINRFLSASSNVIAAIRNKDPHVPYRNSKLTFFLEIINCFLHLYLLFIITTTFFYKISISKYLLLEIIDCKTLKKKKMCNCFMLSSSEQIKLRLNFYRESLDECDDKPYHKCIRYPHLSVIVAVTLGTTYYKLIDKEDHFTWIIYKLSYVDWSIGYGIGHRVGDVELRLCKQEILSNTYIKTLFDWSQTKKKKNMSIKKDNRMFLSLLGHNGDGAARQLDKMLIAMILGEADADADGNEDNEYSDQANEQEDPLNNPNLPPWAKDEAFIEQVYSNSNKCNNKNLKVSMVKNSDTSTQASSRGGRGSRFASGYFGRRKHYRFPPRGKITRFPVTPF
ncbi:hypothetical protein RFI_19867 [Reticulomyxa filosa]|uniref:Kinesin motor domain-containing protein n=1 Tax=Reticulomyxa filosa TaxID=46433 RepID=X6MUZ3_RETFI|nr:hypothetical protein RFI_19867 [Reticulomyxa filosa]|eukprot:ETO17456.1 hypothetical protein RFI_19867 [Reticulomyxa filosa]